MKEGKMRDIAKRDEIHEFQIFLSTVCKMTEEKIFLSSIAISS
jgi:hypothetical protein